MLKSKIFLISLLMLFATACFEKCDNPTTPEVPEETGGKVEFKYVRVFSVINPNAPDLTQGAASIYDGKGGKHSSYWVGNEKDGWTASVYLAYQKRPYYTWVNDYKVSNNTIAEKLFARLKGESKWIELTCIVNNPLDPNGKAAKFIFNYGRIQIPSCSN